jgi:hypothetical protein
MAVVVVMMVVMVMMIVATHGDLLNKRPAC